MWYSIIIFILIFEIVISAILPLFSGLTVNSSGMISANTTALTTTDLASAGFNPFETFAGLMSFSIDGAEFLSTIFVILDILIIICVIKLARGS